MMTIRKTSVFPASKNEVFKRLQKLETLQKIAYPYATFTPVNGKKNIVWKAGETSSYRFRLFGLIPFGTHTIHVVHFGLDEGIYTHEGNEYVPVWNHEIILKGIDDTHTEYTDNVTIDAGWKTIFIYLWAVCFYSHRQREWIKLLDKKNIRKKREREKELVSLMIRIYCRKNHGGKSLCKECEELETYARNRSDKCPFMENKTFCANCKVHCYKPEMREKIRAVMRFSGKRMIFYRPVTAVRHIIETKREKKQLEEHDGNYCYAIQSLKLMKFVGFMPVQRTTQLSSTRIRVMSLTSSSICVSIISFT